MNKMIPSEIIRADESGNAVIGKNVKVDGTTKLIGGLEPVFTDKFKLQDNKGTYDCTFIDYGEFKDLYIHILYFNFESGTSQTIGIGTYSVDNHGVTDFVIYGVSIADEEFQIVSLANRDFGTMPIYTSIATKP